MKFVLYLLFFSSLSLFSQTEEIGYYKLNKLKTDKSTGSGEVNLEFHFQGPDSKPVRSHVKLTVNSDTVKPVLGENGSFRLAVKPGKYKFVFFTPGWYDVGTDSIIVKDNSPLSFFVHFEAKELNLGGLKQKK